MTIGIDANWAIYENAGIGKYTYNLIKALVENDEENRYVLFFNFFRHAEERKKAIEEMVANAKNPVEIHISKMPAAWKETLSQTPFPMKSFYGVDLDVFHSPFFAGVPLNGYSNTVVTIHDLVFMRFPEHRGKLSNYYLKRTKIALAKAKKIIAVSESTKKDLVDLLGVEKDRIKVVYEAADSNFHYIKDRISVKTTLERHDLQPYRYILSVCTLEPRKNLTRLIKAYALLPQSLREKYKLVLTGKQGWNNAEIFKTIKDWNLQDRVVMTGYLPQEDLPYFYNGAAVFAYPALYEGFGLPPLEAMSCGAPVITSNVSSLPEVVGKGAITVDPYDEEKIANALKKLLFSPDLTKKIRLMGLKQAKKFSWEKAVRETIAVYREVGDNKNE